MRLVLPLITILFIVAVAIGFAGYLANRAESQPPEAVMLDNVGAGIAVEWLEPAGTRIAASSATDLYFALGYHDAVKRGFLTALLREIALGRASHWLGVDLLEFDALARRAGIRERAARTLRSLEKTEIGYLRSYADGFNAGLSTAQVHRSPNFVLARIRSTEEWQPAHSLAVEQLVCMLGGHVEATEGLQAAADSLSDRISAISSMVGVGGFRNSFLAAFDGEELTAFRLVTGSVDGGAVAPVVASVGDEQRLLAVMPGLPAPIAGVRGETRWLVIPNCSLQMTDSLALATTTRHFRIIDDRGFERHSSVASDSTGSLWVEPAPETPSSQTVVRWTTPAASSIRWSGGLAFGAEPTPPPPGDLSVVLARADSMTASGDAFISASQGLDLGSAAAGSSDASLRLSSLVLQANMPIEDALGDVRSASASRTLEQRLAGFDATDDPTIDEAIDYLRNWDYTFEPASIGASIYDEVLTQCDRDIQLRDFTFCFPAAVYRLVDVAGRDLSRWRWEILQGASVYSPLGGILARRADPTPSASKYAPVPIRQGGYPTALKWGPSSVENNASVSVEIWCFADLRSCTIRSTYVDFDRAMGRFRAARRAFRVADPGDTRAGSVTQIVPTHD